MKSIAKNFLFLLITLASMSTVGSDPETKILSQKDLNKIEERVQKELKGKNLSTEKKFYLNLLAARELYQYRFYDKSAQYYQNAVKMNVSEQRSDRGDLF